MSPPPSSFAALCASAASSVRSHAPPTPASRRGPAQSARPLWVLHTGISQRDAGTVYPFLGAQRAAVARALVRFFYAHIQAHFPLAHCTSLSSAPPPTSHERPCGT
jgi:hypothetical protein